jgi:hypothetical protein
MPYLTPVAPVQYVPAPRRLRGMRGLGRLGVAIKGPLPAPPKPVGVNPVTGAPIVPPSPIRSPLLPAPPTTQTPLNTPAPTNPQAQSGYCVFTSSPETGGIVSVAQCTAGPGGVPINTGAGGNPYATNTVATPVPPTWPTNQPYTDSQGNVWQNIDGQWEIVSNVATALPANQNYYGPTLPPGMSLQNGNLVPTSTLAPSSGHPAPPPGTPTYPPYYTDSGGGLWYYTTSGWLPRSTALAQGLQPYVPPAYSGSGVYAPTGTSTPPPATWPTNQPYTDPNGNVWTYSAATGWQITSNAYGPGALTATGVNVVPANWPTNEPYTDASGNEWVYTGNGWQISSYGTGANPYTSAAAETAAMQQQAYGGYGAASGAPAAAAPASGGGYESILNWLSEETLISGMPNWLLVAAAGVGFMLLNKRR